MAIKSFRKGQSTYTCRCCGRTTRDVHGEGHTELCNECYELAGFENMLSDEGELSDQDVVVIKDYFITLMGKKVSEETLKKAFPDLFKLAFAVKAETVALVRRIVAKYDYPAGLTDAQKKAFRAKARRAK